MNINYEWTDKFTKYALDIKMLEHAGRVFIETLSENVIWQFHAANGYCYGYVTVAFWFFFFYSALSSVLDSWFQAAISKDEPRVDLG